MKTLVLVLVLALMVALAHVEAFQGQEFFAATSDASDFAHSRRAAMSTLGPAIREKGRCAGTLLEPNTQNLPSPWNGLAFPAELNMPVCQEYQHTNVCCKPGQITSLVSNMAQAANLIARCPSCFANFQRFFCAMTCSPDQSMFFTPLTLFNDSQPNSRVRTIGLTINEAFAKNFYDSCKDVRFPATGGSVMNVFGGSQNWTDYMNFLSISSNAAPPFGALMGIEMSYSTVSVQDAPDQISNTTTVGLAPPNGADPCYSTCSCSDCPSTCPTVPPPPVEPDRTVHIGKSKFAVQTFVVFVIGLIGVLIILSFGFILYATKPKVFKKLQHYNPAKATAHADSKHNLGLMSILASYFRMHGRYVARRPIAVIIVAILFIAFSLCWVWRLKLLTKPEELWVPPGAKTLVDKNHFDDTFGKFYRIEQAILVQKGELANTVILSSANLLRMLDAYEALAGMDVTYRHKNGTLETFNLTSICFRPLVGKGCLVNSPLNYFQESRSKITTPTNPGGANSISGYIRYCTVVGQYNSFCMSSIGTPVDAQNVLGGYPDSSYNQATALVFTFLLNNEGDDDANYRQRAWESAYIDYWKNTPLKDYFDIGFSSERSVQDELARESTGDIPTIVISYVVMFVYVAFALGTLKRPFFLNSKISLALAGILVVIFSIAISIGLCSLFGVAATLIITEVIPFLVLAIGVDNIFILVDTFTSLPSKESSIEDRIGETLARAGTSITMAAFSEGAAFLLGMLTRMPAVTAFAVYSCVAILFNWALQITFFVALIAIDAHRKESGRYDVLCCIRRNPDDDEVELDPVGTDSTDRNGNGAYNSNEHSSNGKSSKGNLNGSASSVDADTTLAASSSSLLPPNPTHEHDPEGDPIQVNGLVAAFFNRFYAPFLLHPITKIFVIALFLILLMAGIGLIQHIEIGLPQEQAMPKDSYLIDYYQTLADYGKAGPPVYIVLNGPFNYTERVSQNLLCSIDARPGGCSLESMDNTFYINAKQTDTGFLVNTTLSSWLDTYLIWLRPSTGCCNQMANGTFCHLEDGVTLPSECSICLQDSDFDSYGRPSEATFMNYFDTWLTTICSTSCGSCGSVFASEIQLDRSKPHTSSEYINSTRFRAYHKNLVNQTDFIDSLKKAYDFTDDLSSRLGLDAYPYSSYYIFFEQYQYVQSVAKLCIGVALAAIFVVTLLLLANVYGSVIIVIIVGVIQVDLLGVMGLWHINLNAVSVVNLVMAIGISVEFCVHICHSFITHNGSRQHRAKLALVEMGSSVLKGITLTKFVGVIVLAFAKSKIFQIYYFRMFFAIVILAGLHCLVFLPVLLSLIGPRTRRGPFALF